MADQPKQRRRLCIFCGGGNLSKEHFYPTWMHPLLPANTIRGEKIIHSHPIHGERTERDVTGNAGIETMKLRVVCEPCNNGWMNRLEAAARPHLTKMVQGKRHLLSGEAQLAIARWCAAKVMVAEHAPAAVPMTPPADRQRFSATLDIPDYYRIYVCAHRCDAQLGYFRRTSTVSLDPSGPVPKLDGMGRNVQQVSFLLGKALVHVNAARVEGFAIEDRFKMPIVHQHARLWPPTVHRLKWPGRSILTFEQVRVLSNSWKIVANSNRTLWSETPESGWD